LFCIRRLLKAESGYSLIEVVAAIVILTIAIIPMVGVFDSSLRSTMASSNYDKARALANLKLEQAKSLPFDSSDTTRQDVKDTYPELPPTTTTYNGWGTYQSAWLTESGPASAEFTTFRYRIQKQYITQPPTTPTTSSPNFAASTSATNLIRVTVIVGWGHYNAVADTYSQTFTTSGLVTG
jgi:prepilin-type N-terminal cleavage/methylation domain-containing protein